MKYEPTGQIAKTAWDDSTVQIIKAEFQMFQAVDNQGGRASCQDDFDTFQIMRGSQFSVWPAALRESYLQDLRQAAAVGRNLVAEKYAWMMEETHPEEFSSLRPSLPVCSSAQQELIRTIISLQATMAKAVYLAFPLTCACGRPLYPDPRRPQITSSMTYLRGELCTYSENTLAIYLNFLRRLRAQGRNLPQEILEQTTRQYGYAGLAAREDYLWGKSREQS